MTDFSDPRPATRRDRWGRYLVLPPGADKPVGYTRATTVADTISDKENLFPWSQVMAMTGLMRRPGLRGRFEALMSEHPLTGPWYGGEDAKNECKKIAAEAKEAGGASDRADLGTSRHTIIEQVHRGQAPLLTQADTQADIDAYTATIETAGLQVDPTLVETIVVHDGWKIAGTADMLRITVPGVGDVVGDLKTGATLDFSHGAIAQQLAIYANADNVYRQGAAADGSEDQRLPMPAVSKERALVIHLPAGEARCTLHWVDIAAGAEAVEHALWVREWRKRKHLFTLFQPVLNAGQTARVEAVKQTPATERPPVETVVEKVVRPDTPVGRKLDEMDAETSKLEGGPAPVEDVNTIRARIELGLTPNQTKWVGYLRTVVSPGLTERRANIYCAITKLVTSDLWDDNVNNFNEIVQAAVNSVSRAKKPRKLSAAIAGLTLNQSAAFRQTVDRLIDDPTILEVDPTSGACRIKAA